MARHDSIRMMNDQPVLKATVRSDALRRSQAVIALAAKCETAFSVAGKDAARCLAESQLGLEAITEVALNGTPGARRRALYLLSLWDGRLVFQTLAHALLGDDSAVVRHEAAFFLGALGIEEAQTPLVHALLSDSNELVRHEAAEALWDMGCAKAIDALRQALGDPSAAVRETVAMALAELAG